MATPPPPTRSFAELGLPEPLVTALNHKGVREPFAIQVRTLPDALAGADVLGRAQTGSGKTLAFGLPMLARLAGAATRTAGHPRGLVLLPTRELARQVSDVLAPLAAPLGLNVLSVYGGAPIGRQIDRLRRGVDILVATPGRLVDLIERRSCSLDQVEITVLDEADYMADLGFLPVVRNLLGQTPSNGQRLLFSATLDRGVERLVTEFLHDPKVHAVAAVAAPVDAADHHMFVVPSAAKVEVAGEIAGRPARTLIFVRTKHGADRLARQLSRTGVNAGAIHGNLNQNQRQRALTGFSAGHPRVLVATDVAARGIHVDDVDLVVHFDPPEDHKDYLHRSGRTARAGARGTVVALVDPAQVSAMNSLHREAGVRAQRTTDIHPQHEAVKALATSGEAVPPPPPRAPAPAGDRPPSRRRRPQQQSGGRPSNGSRGRGGAPGSRPHRPARRQEH